MSRANPFVLTGILAIFVAIYGGLSVLAGGLYLDSHEGDTYHFIDIVQRMASGDVPHLDYMTPLGVLSFWPVVQFVKSGFTIGISTIYAQIAVAVILFPLVIYAGATRMSRGVAILFGLLTLGLALALNFGGAGTGVAIAMHYNRWAWSITFVILALAFLPARSRGFPMFESAVIGALMSVLLLMKVTYFVALFPAVALALLGRWHLSAILAAAIGGLIVAGAVTFMFGPTFWFAYLADLRAVAASEIRPFVGVPLNEILVGPGHIAATLVGIAALWTVRQTEDEAIKTPIVLLIPGLIYITYQNFGNDPQWLLFVPVLLLSLRPTVGAAEVFNIDLRHAMTATAFGALLVAFPSLFNVAMSPVEHLAFDKSRFVPMIPEDKGNTDLHIRVDRGYMVTAQVYKDQQTGPWSTFEQKVDREPEPEFEGITFENCELFAGSRAYFDAFTEGFASAGLPEGSRIFTADILAAFWLFGPYAPPENGAPWYYGNLTGLENSDYLVIPKCGFVNRIRGIIIEELNAADFDFDLVEETDLYALFAVGQK